MMKNKIIRLLWNSKGDYISGEQISRQLGITRSAVWKSISSIKSDGAEIEASSGKGYKLNKLPDLLKPEYLNAYSDKLPGGIRWFEEVDSTNNYLKELSRDKSIKEAVAVVEFQTGGKGRLGRIWTSNQGDSIQMSFLIKPDASPADANAYNFAGALGICRAIKNACGIDVKIKWPNDIVYDGKKICGILTEMSTDMNQIEYIVFGAGINVNQKEFDGELSEKAVSLRMIKGRKIDRLALCAEEITCVFDYFELINDGKKESVMKEYENKSAILGKRINLISRDKTIGGVCEGFGADGELLLDTDGKIKSFHAGEVSVRGETGYV